MDPRPGTPQPPGETRCGRSADLEDEAVVVVLRPPRPTYRLLEVADRVDGSRHDGIGALLQVRLQLVGPLRGARGLHVGLPRAAARLAEAALRSQPLALLADAAADRERHVGN